LNCIKYYNFFIFLKVCQICPSSRGHLLGELDQQPSVVLAEGVADQPASFRRALLFHLSHLHYFADGAHFELQDFYTIRKGGLLTMKLKYYRKNDKHEHHK